MSYHEILKTNYSEIRRRLWGDEPAPTITIREAIRSSGTASGKMWHGIDDALWAQSTRRPAADIIRAVLLVTSVNRNDFMSHRRPRHICEARQIAFFFMRYYTRLSSIQIGKLVGGRDHSTVFHGIDRVIHDPEKFGARVLEVAQALRLSPPKEMRFQ